VRLFYYLVRNLDDAFFPPNTPKTYIGDGRRIELTGGGLTSSAGGWEAVKALRRSTNRMQGDERILSDGDFVEQVLKTSAEELERKYKLATQGFDFE